MYLILKHSYCLNLWSISLTLQPQEDG